MNVLISGQHCRRFPACKRPLARQHNTDFWSASKSSTISRNHFVVSFDNGSYSIQDLGSSNGTLVNGVKVSQSKLNHGDVIGVGEILLTCHI